jgi:hypothetical protein
MNRLKKITLLILTLTLLGIANNDAQAQRNRRKKGVVRHHHVKVVHRAPHRVVVRKAHVRYAHLPRWGTAIAVAPAAAIIIKSHPNPYYFDNGIYYTPRGGNYTIVRPVPGVRINVLPVGYRRVVVGPRPYFYYYGTYYAKIDNADAYETINAPVGAVVDALPDGYEIKTIKDIEYYVLDDVYYAEVDAPEFDDNVGYEVVDIS